MLKIFSLAIPLVLSFGLNAQKRDSKAYVDLTNKVSELELKLEQLSSRQEPERANLFNPQITVFGNFLGCKSFATGPELVDSHDDHDHSHLGCNHSHGALGDCSDGFRFREIEFDFRAAVDPWADAVVIAAVENHEGSIEFDIEEAYVGLKKLPILDLAPLGMKFKLGKFRASFGRLNRIHLHDLPQSTSPLSLQGFFGEHGLIGTGISSDVIIPTPGDSNSLGLTLELINGNGGPFARGYQGAKPTGIIHPYWFFDIGQSQGFEVGASTYLGASGKDGEHFAQIYGVDLNYDLKMNTSGGRRSFLIGGEFFAGHDGDKHIGRSWPLGAFAWTQYQFSQNVYASARYSWLKGIDDENKNSHALGAFVSYYTTEFLRLRLGYEHIIDDVSTRRANNVVMFELNFIFGSHPSEPYWVNL